MDITQFIVSRRERALLVGDYGLYRKQLSRRLLVVRKKLNHTSRGHKYTPRTPITAEDIGNNHEFVHLMLLAAERAWALAMHIKSTHAADVGTQAVTGSTKRHIISKFQKANIYATQLVALLQEQEKCGASIQSVQEARAYQQSLRGSIAFEKRSWERCLQSYSETRFLYTALAQTMEAGARQDDLFKDLLSATVDPSLRYAAYQLKLPRTMSIEAIVARYLPRESNAFVTEVLRSNPDLLQESGAAARKNTTGSADVPKTINWRSRTVNLEDASTAQALASLSAAEANLASFLATTQNIDRRAKAAAFDDVLLPSQDAVDATKTAIDELTAEGIPQGDPRMQSLQITRTAVNYNLVEWRVGRNRVLCGDQDGAVFEDETVKKPKKPRADDKSHSVQEESSGRKLNRLKERVVLYESTLQSLDSIKELPGVLADQTFMNELEVKRSYFSSLRCLAIARSHMLHGSKRNSLALLSRALDLSSQASSSSSLSKSGTEGTEGLLKLEVTPAQAGSLKDLLERSVLQYRALVELENLDSAASQNKQSFKARPMVERLNEYPPEGVDLTNLVTYPPKIQPIPVKPIFLDVAWNYIDYPGRPKKGASMATSEVGEAAASKPEPKKEAKKGWFGFGR
ncbi:MAG: hypothetical protein Q9216_004055 [Gyalolechia sp. 2 TL-2023]